MTLTPKEKAKEIVDKYKLANVYFKDKQQGAKHIAILHCDQMLELFSKEFENITLHNHYVSKHRYYSEVRTEIEKL